MSYFKISVFLLLLVQASLLSAQNKKPLEDYLLLDLPSNKKALEKILTDTSYTAYYNYSQQSSVWLYSTALKDVDCYNFRLKEYAPIPDAIDNWWMVYRTKGKINQIELSLYFDIEDTLQCQNAFSNFLTSANIEASFPIVYRGTSTNLVQYSNVGKKINDTSPDQTPYHIFYKTEQKKEGISIYYHYKKRSQEIELIITYFSL